jgi:hypothetical protein
MYKIIGANNAEYGPVSAEQLRQWINEGRVNAETLAQAAGETGWKPISSYPEFADVFASRPSAPPAPPSLGKSPPAFTAGASSIGEREAVLSEVSGPGVGLIVVGALGIVYGAMGIVGVAFQSAFAGLNGMNNMNFPGQNPEMLRFIQMSQGVFGLVFAVIHLALGGLVIYGGIKMKALENYSLCMIASIIAIIPCISPCCCVGIPLGIWAVVVLNKPEVKAHFS